MISFFSAGASALLDTQGKVNQVIEHLHENDMKTILQDLSAAAFIFKGEWRKQICETRLKCPTEHLQSVNGT
jgi:hypothetical protein